MSKKQPLALYSTMELHNSALLQTKQKSSREYGPAGFGARSLDVVDYMGARVSELRALRNAAVKVCGNRRVYQQLSWHQRRRTMSHSSHRMPARLRTAHRRELTASNVLKSASKAKVDVKAGEVPELVERPVGPRGKMRCRKYRRRAKFLLAHRRLRAKSPSWLETHIWHAKRFHMDSLPGGRCIAIAPNDRGLRSGYRALAHTSLVHDASYLDVIELRAEERKNVTAVFRACLCEEDFARLIVDPAMNGTRRVDALSILDGTRSTIAPVYALWRPSENAQIWVWCHPSASSAVVAAFENASANAGFVDVTLIRGDMLQFSVIGPRAGAVIGAVMSRVRLVDDAKWNCVTGIRSPACLPHGCVVALEVEDPRGSFPPKRTGEGGKIKANSETTSIISKGFDTVLDSGLWSAELRKEYTRNAKMWDGERFSFVPVICMQRPAGLSRGFGSGWDIVLPAGWGMIFWMSLMYANGGRAAGQREIRQLGLETCLPVFPEDYQDTLAGRASAEPGEIAMTDAHARRPKSKRVNYALYRVPWPFSSDWSLLHGHGVEVLPENELDRLTSVAGKRNDRSRRPRKRGRFGGEDCEVDKEVPLDVATSVATNQCSVSVRVLRSASAIQRTLGIDPKKGQPRKKSEEKGGVRWVRANELELDKCTGPSSRLQTCLPGNVVELVRVILRPCRKGSVTRNALICMPTAQDLKMMSQKRRDEYRGPTEALATGFERNRIVAPSRHLIGRVAYGDYSLSRGHCMGSGVITTSGIQGLIACGAVAGQKNRQAHNRRCVSPSDHGDGGFIQVRVLYRNISSLQYRAAVATVHM